MAADLDGGMFLLETGIGGNEQMSSFMNATLQRVGEFDISVALFIEPPAEVLAKGEEAIGAWLAYWCGGASVDAIKQGGVARFHVQIGPAED